MAKMKAAIFVEPGRIALAEKTVPDVGPLDALLRVTTTTICGTDIHILKGEYRVRKGLTVGHEPVGVIEKLGSAVVGYRMVAVELPERPPARDRWLTRRRLLALSAPPVRRRHASKYADVHPDRAVHRQAQGAILSLRWPQVDLDKGTINFEIPGRNPTNKRRGIVAIPPSAHAPSSPPAEAWHRSRPCTPPIR